jgi:hypothetical protein
MHLLRKITADSDVATMPLIVSSSAAQLDILFFLTLPLL